MFVSSMVLNAETSGCGVPELVLANKHAALGANRIWRPVLLGLAMRLSASRHDCLVYVLRLYVLAEYIKAPWGPLHYKRA